MPSKAFVVDQAEGALGLRTNQRTEMLKLALPAGKYALIASGTAECAEHRSVICFIARNIAWSFAVQSVSRFCMKFAIDGNAWLLTVVSMWNTRTVSSMSWPWRMHEWCSAESGGFIYDRDARSVLALWCARIPR